MKRDRDYTFGYPPLTEPLAALEIWDREAPRRKMALYVHIPFCRSFCKYCPFTKYLCRHEAVEEYVGALKREMEMAAQTPAMRHARIAAVFFGGGTPTCLDSRQLRGVLECARRHFSIAEDAEITIEANPDTVDRQSLKVLAEAGVNRVSFGVQSFDDDVLKMLGCRHDGDTARRAVKLALEAGLDNVGIDVMFGLPGQTAKDWDRALETALALEVPHITTPELSVDKGTRLYNELAAGALPPCPGEEGVVSLYMMGRRILEGAGYRLYNLGYDFAREGKECLYHRMNWEAPQHEVAAFGAGAYGYVNGAAYLNEPRLEHYCLRLHNGLWPVVLGKRLSLPERMARYMVHGVYMKEVNKRRFLDIFGSSMDRVYGEVLRRLAGLGWIENHRECVQLTEEGIIFVNNVSKSFYPELFAGGIR
jgi:oxygen-independent coproporphyrinogen-3 oxidase